MESKFKRAFTRTTAVLFAALLLGTSAYVPQAVHIVPTSIVANAVEETSVSSYDELIAAINNGGNIKLTADISTNNAITISQPCTIDFNKHTLTITNNNGGLNVNAAATLKNGSLALKRTTVSYRGNRLYLNSDATIDSMTITSSADAGASLIDATSSQSAEIFIKDTTIRGTDSAFRAFGITNKKVTFLGNVVVEATVDAYPSMIRNSDLYFVGNLTTCSFFSFLTASNVHFCGGSVVGVNVDKVFSGSGFSSSSVKLENDNHDYKLYTDEACTTELTTGNAASAKAIYSKLNPRTREVDFSGLGDATITLTGRDNENIPLSDGKGTIIEGGKVTSSVPLVFTGAEVTESVDNNTYTYTIDSIPGNTVTVKEAYIQEGTYWGLKADGTVEIFGQMPNTDLNPKKLEFYQYRNDIKKIVALDGAKSGTDLSDAFWGYPNLEELHLSKLDTSKCTTFQSFVFYETKLKVLDVKGMDTSSAENMFTMFYNLHSLESIDISGFDFSKVTNAQRMFEGCGALKEIKLSEDTPITAAMLLPNTQSDAFVSGWYNADGELVSGTGEFAVISGVSGTLKRIKGDVSDLTITVDDQLCTGEEVKPTVTVKKGNDTLTENTDYTVAYSNNIATGKATVTVTGIGDYVGKTTKTFKILSQLDASGLNNTIKVKVFDENENEVQPVDGKLLIMPGYTVASSAALSFSGAKAAEYEPNEAGSPHPDYYAYEITKATAKTVVLSHKHDTETRSDYRLQIKCDTEVGKVLETLAELTVNGNGIYDYGEKIEINQDNQGPDGAYAAAAERYGNGGPIRFVGKPAYHDRGTENDNWDGKVRTDIGSYIVNSGAKYLNATYYLYKDYEIRAKNVDGLTAMIDLDGEGTAYSEVESAQLPTITYDGKTYTPTAKLVYKDFWDGTDTLTNKTLELDKDYTVQISAGQNAGEYQIVFTGKGNFTGTKTVTWNIANANMTLVDDNQGQAYQFVYNGANTVNTTAFKVSGAPEGAQATYTYFSDSGLQLTSAPTTVGSYRVKITYAKANYNNADITLNFNVTKRPVKLTPAADQKITYGEAIPTEIRYTVEAANGDRGLVAGDEITGNLIAVVGTGILNAGTYDYVLVDSECDFANYTVTLNSDSKFTVEKKALTKDMFTVSPTSLDYTGQQQTVAVNGSDLIGVQLIPGDFEMPAGNPDSQYNLLTENDWSIVGNTNKATEAGTYVVKVKASDNGNYTGEIELDNANQKWTINSKSMSNSDISVLAPDKTYTGSDITETVTVKDGTTTLVEGTDYEIITEKIGDKYTDAQSLTQKLAGTYTFYIKGKGNYADDKKGTWQIKPADIYSIKVAGGSKTYDGKPVTEKDFRVTTKLTETSTKDPNADIKYNFVFKKNGEVVTDPKDAGTYTVEVTAYDEKGNYQSKTVGTDGDIIFTIAKRKVELYPNEGQSAEYGTDVAGLRIAYTTEVADEESITGLLPTDTVDFSSALTVEFGEETPVPVGFYPIKINEAIDFGNYQAVKGEDVEFEITKATLKDNWFAVYLDEDRYVGHTFDGKNIKVKVVDVNGSLEQNKDFTATGDFEAYLPGTYTITVKGKGNYQGKVTKTWKIDANKTVKAYTTVATEESSDVHVYDGEAPAVNVVPNDAENPLPEFTDVTYDYYVKDTATGEWTKLTAAPTDAGSYKVQGNAASKGYEIDVSAKEYTIAKKPIQITIDPKDLTGTYGQETFTIPYTVAEDAIIEKDKANGVAVSGAIVVNAAGKDTGVLDIDFSGVTVNSTNYELVFPENTTFTLAPKQLKDENIVFENASADLHDIGTTRITYKVVVNGKELVEGTDYEASGTTEADEAGSYKVQIVGKGNYAGFAEAAWTLAYNEEARNAALEAIAENVTASFKSDDNGIVATAAFTGGKRKVTVTAVAALKDGLAEGDKYTVTRTGMVYYNGDMEGFDAATLTVDNADGVTMFDAGRNNLKEYKYGMIDVNKGIVAKAYAVVNDGSYETVVYSDAVTLNYDELIRYNVKVNGGTIVATGEKEAQYSGTDIQQNKPFVRVTVDAADIPEGQQFLCWTKNGVVASYAETFSFYMSEKDTVVTALYADKDEEIERLAASYMDSITLLPDQNKFKCVTMSSVPSDCTILKSGLIFTAETITNPDEFTSEKYASTVRGNATTAHNYRYTWTKANVGEGTYYVRSYVKYTDANGVEKETYGDVYKISMNGYEIL